MSERFENILPPLTVSQVRELIAEGKFIGEKSGRDEEFKELVELNPYIYENDVAYHEGDWLYVYGPGDQEDVMFFAELISEEGTLSFLSEDDGSDWNEQINEKFED